MLSFDITDRNIRVVRGVEGNGKIKINSAATVNVEEGLIVNGHVKDVPAVATLINNVIKMHRMPDKEAIVSISSNLTIFKEMTVAKGRGQDLQKTVKLQMQAELNLDDSYSVSYIIVGDADSSEVSEPSYKILATACPYEIVNSYREMFKLLGITLRSVMIGCNCITKVLLADTKIRSKMPLLAVQIDNNFISLNLYEQGQLSFSRFASIDAADYGYSDDYVFEAVNENIFRMLQFHRSRNTGESIENVIFYGDTHEYVRLTDELEKLDLKTSLINVPPQIHGHENLEFSLYANAIGAMFKRNREIEKINLLETDFGTAVKNKIRNESSGNVAMLAALIGSVVIAGGIYAWYYIKDKGIQSDIEECETFINSDDTAKKLAHRDRLIEMKKSVNAYYTKVNNSYDAYQSKPVVEGKVYEEIEKILKETCEKEKIEEFKILTPKYTDGTIQFTVECDANKDQFSQKLPSNFVDKILSDPMFCGSSYGGYNITKFEEPGKEPVYKMQFASSAKLTGFKSAYRPDEENADKAE
ncbi:pilus assembly protein PilM [Ruminococcus sp.]|uniref:pilus assembly protein PilM n=1 Tax=Ruminococcus sp. TaxID=41978 RepID=UPI0025D68796|nr:pilus assembly protein PilM [Ruminococcus sp.]